MPRWTGWVVSLGVMAMDQGTKIWAMRALGPGETRTIWDGIFKLTMVHNPGAAFGVFPQGTAAFLAVSTVVALGLFAYLFFSKPSGPRAWGSALILGGTLGNLIDRARLGYVVDFLALGNWTVFNVADVALVLGVGLTILGLWWGSR